jgi:ABC-type phosphate transport system permease subunit
VISAFSLRIFQKPPIIVKLIEPPKDPTGLADVLIGALGLTGAITLIAVTLGVLTALIIFWARRASSR